VQRLTPKGWREAPWLNPHAGDRWVKIDESKQVRRKSLQRLNFTIAEADEERTSSRTRTSAERLTDWLLPPLPYGAPWYFSVAQYDKAIVDYCQDYLPPGLDQDESHELLDQARKGYERQESRVAEIENRASGYDGYAAAAAALAALGATLLGSDRASAFGDVRQPLLLSLLVAATACLIMSGFRAWQAAAKPFDWMRPHEPSLVRLRFGADARDPPIPRDQVTPQSHLLVSLLIAAERGQLLADWKRARFRQASRAFSLALIFVILAAIILVVR